MTPWVECKSIDINLDLPWNEAIRDVPAEQLAASRRLLEAIAAAGTTIPAPFVQQTVRERTGKRFDAEIQAWAAAAGVDAALLALANVSYDLLLALFGCSTMALATPSGPVLARNMDWFPEAPLARASCQIRYSGRTGLKFIAASWAGATGIVTGMSARGFAIALNAVSAPESGTASGYPVLLHLRRTLEDAASFGRACDMLASEPLLSPALFTIVGTTNHERAVIERSYSRHALRTPVGDAPLVATNDYRRLFAPQESDLNELTRTTCHRYDALSATLAAGTPIRERTDEELLDLLTDPRVKQTITAQHVIARPAIGQMRTFVPRELVED